MRHTGARMAGSSIAAMSRRVRTKSTPSTGDTSASAGISMVTASRSQCFSPRIFAAVRPPIALSAPACRTPTQARCAKDGGPVVVLTTSGVRSSQRPAAIWFRTWCRVMPRSASCRREIMPAWRLASGCQRSSCIGKASRKSSIFAVRRPQRCVVGASVRLGAPSHPRRGLACCACVVPTQSNRSAPPKAG